MPIKLVGGKVEDKAEQEAVRLIKLLIKLLCLGPQQVVRGLDINPVIASETLRRLALIFAVGPRALIKLLPNQSKGGRKACQG